MGWVGGLGAEPVLELNTFPSPTVYTDTWSDSGYDVYEVNVFRGYRIPFILSRWVTMMYLFNRTCTRWSADDDDLSACLRFVDQTAFIQCKHVLK